MFCAVVEPRDADVPEALDTEEMDLVLDARSGCADAFAKLVDRHRMRIRRLVRSRVSNVEDAADIEQDVFVKAFTSLSELTDAERFGAWLTMIARHACIDYVRRRGRIRFISIDEPVNVEGEPLSRQLPDPQADTVARVHHRQLRRAYSQALGSLTDLSREALLMRQVEGLSMEEIADRIDGTVGSAKSLIYRARRKLEETLSPHLAA